MTPRPRPAPRRAPLIFALTALLLATPLAATEAQQAGDQEWRLLLEVQPDLSERLTLTIESPGDVRRAYDALCLPEGAEVVGATADGASLDHEVVAREGGGAAVAFATDAEVVRIEMARGPPEDAWHPVYRGSVSPCVGAGDAVTLTAEVPEGFTLFAATRGAQVAPDGASATLQAVGAASLQYAYEAPLGEGANVTVVEAGPFRAFAPAERAEAARRVVEVAAPLAPRAFEAAGLELPWDRVRVRFAPGGGFAWETGRYVGEGIVLARGDLLTPEPTRGFPWVGARTLVHEAFHGASVPHGLGALRGALGWWVEGTAGYAERVVTGAHPEAARYCEAGGGAERCWVFDAALDAERLAALYEGGFTFDPAWSPGEAGSEEERQLLYAYSEFLVAAYVDRFGEAAYRAVWDDVQEALAAAAAEGGGAAPDAGFLEASLRRHAGEPLPDAALYYPFSDLLAEDPEAFRERVAGLVAPGLSGREGGGGVAPGAE